MIKQNAGADALPDFRNLGVMLRILLISNIMALLLALTQAGGWADVPQRMMQIATLLTPILLATLVLLWAAQPWLARLGYWRGGLAGDLSGGAVAVGPFFFRGAVVPPP